jgi:subtilisin family serine protease
MTTDPEPRALETRRRAPPASRRCRAALRLALLLAWAGTAPAQAQLRLPSLPLPGAGLPLRIGSSLPQRDTLLDPPDLLRLRRDSVDRLLRRHHDVIEADPAGEPAVRGEIVALAPLPAAQAAALAAGFAVLRTQNLDALSLQLVVYRPPPGVATAAGLQQLRTLDPAGSYDFNHIYTGGGEIGAPPTAAPAPAPAAPAPAAAPIRVGLVDSGVDGQAIALDGAAITPWGCAGKTMPGTHGTAVASLLVGDAAAFRGAAPHAALYAADVYCDAPTGGAVETIAAALAWMAQQRVPVVNISLVGPPDRLLQAVTAAMLARGHLLVAAVGNDGPAAPPLYPASYPGVVGVTAVDRHRKALPEAAQGPQVAFAAPGADMVAAGGAAFVEVRGTSFAAPLVAGLLAQRLRAPDAAQATQAQAQLAAAAQDLGAPGRDPVYGNGLVGMELRVDPEDAR